MGAQKVGVETGAAALCVSANSNEPSVIYDVDAFTRTESTTEVAWEGAVRARFRDGDELSRFKRGLDEADCSKWRRRADAS